jgi:hypothetical protein
MTFDRDALRQAVAILKTKLERLKGSRMNEENTKMALIAPMIRALGWDTTDPDEVNCEFRHKPKDTPVDFALMLQRTPRLLIEAKPLGHDLNERRAVNQVISYSTQAGVQWVVLTNGAEWCIYNSTAQVPIDGKLFRRLSLAESSAEEFSSVLGLLSKPEMLSQRIAQA